MYAAGLSPGQAAFRLTRISGSHHHQLYSSITRCARFYSVDMLGRNGNKDQERASLTYQVYVDIDTRRI